MHIPPEYRFDTDEVYLLQDPLTGDIIVSKQPDSWDDYYDAIEELNHSGNFASDKTTMKKRLVKLSTNGRSHVVQISEDHRFDADQAYLFQDPLTGDVIISRQPNSWDVFFNLVEKLDMPTDFMEHRAQGDQVKRDLFLCQKNNTC